MSLFLRSTKVELVKILIRVKYYVLLLIELLITATVVLFTSANGFAVFGLHMDLPAIPYAVLNSLTVFVLPLIIFMVCADLFTNEIETGMLKAVLLRPIGRFMIFASKITAVTLYVFLHLMAVCALILALKLMLGSPADLPTLPAAFALSIFPMIAFVSFSTLICLLVSNSSLAMFVSMILYFIMQGVTLASAPVGAVFFTSHLNVYRMILSPQYQSALPNTLLLILSTIVLTSAAGFWLFDRQEL
ncbi:MAG: ABC transporter permease [Clostridiales bacterium]|jgi:ABC-2 type transport system permease protein|nr:ABC transporter permease [Clostridiales bacterium]